jgi:hypothetical protein
MQTVSCVWSQKDNFPILVKCGIEDLTNLKNGVFWDESLVRTDVSEEVSASFIRMTRICELGTTLAVTSNRRTLRRDTK